MKEFIRCSPTSVHYILDDHSNKQASADKRIAAATHLLRKQYEVGGVKPVIQSMEEVLEAYEFIDETMRVECTKAVFESLLPIGGNELVKAVLEHDDYKLTRAFAYTCDLEIADTIDDLAMQTQDQELTEKTRLQTTYAWSAGQTFNDWAEALLESDDRSWCAEDERTYTLQSALEILGCTLEIKPEEAKWRGLENTVLHKAALSGCYKTFDLLNRIHTACGNSHFHEEALLYFHSAVESKNPDLIEKMVETAIAAKGHDYAINLLFNGHYREEDLEYRMSRFQWDILEAYRNEPQRYFDLLDRMGGQNLIDKLVPPESDESIDYLYWDITTTEPGLMEQILQRLSPSALALTYERLPEWKAYMDGAISERQFAFTHKRGNARWIEVTGSPSPDPILKNRSPFGFKQSLYEKILPALSLLAEIEGKPQSASIYAYKLSTLFSSEEEIDAYLCHFAKEWGAESKNILHDACLFGLPHQDSWVKISEQSSNVFWNIKGWKKLLMVCGPEVFPYLKSACYIEDKIAENSFPENILELRACLANVHYERAEENSKLAELSMIGGLTKEKFEWLLDYVGSHIKETDFLPSVWIDGAKIGFSDIYMERLQPSDPLGYFLGLVSNSCQSVDHNGEACALYGMSNPYSGFYVWRSRSQVVNEEDPIVAQSWVWIGEDNALVFDSFERVKSAHNKFLQPFIEQFAYQVIDQHGFEDAAGWHHISAVRLGCDPSGQTPPLPLPKTRIPSQIRDYSGMYSDGTPARDSNEQYIITPINRVKQPQIKLAAATDRSETKEIAANYIESVTDAWQREHGLSVQAAVSLQFYVAGADWIPITDSRDLKALRNYWEREGLIVTQNDQERTHGIHRLCGPWRSPMKAAVEMQVAREITQALAEQQGLKQAHFTPRPYKGREWLGGSLAVSLQGDLSCLADAEKLAAFSANLGAFTQQSFLAYAEKDIDYPRFWNSAVAPQTIQPGPNNQHGLSFVADRSGLLIENRLLSTNGNILTALAATLAGVEHALASFAHPPECQFDIPNSREQAFTEMNKGLQRGSFSGATPLFDAIAKQHKPIPIDRPLPAMGQHTAQAKL